MGQDGQACEACGIWVGTRAVGKFVTTKLTRLPRASIQFKNRDGQLGFSVLFCLFPRGVAPGTLSLRRHRGPQMEKLRTEMHVRKQVRSPSGH